MTAGVDTGARVRERHPSTTTRRLLCITTDNILRHHTVTTVDEHCASMWLRCHRGRLSRAAVEGGWGVPF